MAGPLSGLRVMDVCQLAVGPWGASLLGQLGAEVIKIEVPDGDPIRNLLPHMEGVGTYYTSVNVSKKNIALDLKNPRHLEIALKIAERSDAFVENFRPGVMERLGLGYEALSALNPDIVYCSASGYGGARPAQARGERGRLRPRLHRRSTASTDPRAGGRSASAATATSTTPAPPS